MIKVLYVKTEFVEFEVEIKGAKFKLVEGDPTRFMLSKIKSDGGNKVILDINDIQDAFIDECLVGWEGMFANETKAELPFKKENFRFLTTEIKSTLWGKFVARCSLSETEKKS